jgi:hypothetical protein
MTGKELKEWACKVPEDSVITAKTAMEYRFNEITELRAELLIDWKRKKDDDADV